MSKLDYLSLGLIFFSVITIILGIIKIHTYPGKIVKARKHPQTQAIDILSLLGLIIFPLWMAALVWANGKAQDVASDQLPKEEPERGLDFFVRLRRNKLADIGYMRWSMQLKKQWN